jgi:hypothetical integral membrane protein (TIGR02206 family)
MRQPAECAGAPRGRSAWEGLAGVLRGSASRAERVGGPRGRNTRERLAGVLNGIPSRRTVSQFSPPHLAALGVLVIAASGSVWLARTQPHQTARFWARLLALAILAGWAGEYVADVIEGTYDVQYTLPLQLTDAVSATSIVALWTRRQLLVELTYFWAITASLQATVTPDLGQNFPSIFYFTYFTYHIGAVVAAFLLVFGLGIYPRRRAAWRAFALTLCFAAVAGVGDVLTGGNYMYLRSKPIHSSLLSVMGPWPWYIASAAAFGLVLLLALQWVVDRLRYP